MSQQNKAFDWKVDVSLNEVWIAGVPGFILATTSTFAKFNFTDQLVLLQKWGGGGVSDAV